MVWYFLDDQVDAANALAGALREGPFGLDVTTILPSQKAQVLEGHVRPDGMLLDVELTGERGELGSGPGIAQDIRVRQRAQRIGEFPLVRFAGRGPIEANIAGDPASDDLFDLLIAKEALTRGVKDVQQQLQCASTVYAHLAAWKANGGSNISELLGLSPAELELWSHEGFHQRVTAGCRTAVHIAANSFLRSFLFATGLLIDEELLATRLGINRVNSGEAWGRVLQRVEPYLYRGVGSNVLTRWWAGAIGDWWSADIERNRSVHSMTANERIDALMRAGLADLIALQLPAGSAGTKPWRLCALSLEREPPEFVPIDPNESVRVQPDRDLPAWVDPPYAALGVALREEHEDLRLSKDDLNRLRRKHA